MKVTKIDFLNIDKLYQIAINKEEDPNYKLKQFGRNLPQLYSHIVIKYDLTEVTPIEYIFLKMISSNITIYNCNVINNKDYLEKNFNEIYGSILSSYIEEIINSKDIEEPAEYLPVAAFLGDCIVSFTGSQLVSLIGMDPRDFFIKASNRKCVIPGKDENTPATMDHDFIIDIENNNDLKNGCIAMLINTLYKFMMEKLTYVDIPSEAFCSSMFDGSSDENIITIASVRNPYLNLNFSEGINKLKPKFEAYKEMNLRSITTINNTFIEFNISTSLQTFVELFRNIPYDKFITISNFRLLVTNPRMSDEKMPENEAELIEYFDKKVKDTYNDLDRDILKLVELTKFGTIINYSLLLSINDVDNLSDTFPSSFFENNQSEFSDILIWIISETEFIEKYLL